MTTHISTQEESLHDVYRLARGELSLAARLAYVGLLLLSAAMGVVVVSLWITEPALPVRTQATFGVMSLISFAWIVFSVWALTARRPLFARDEVVAATMAVVFSGLFTVGGLAAVIASGAAAAFGALASGVGMLAIAAWRLVRARRRYAALEQRRAELERALNTP